MSGGSQANSVSEGTTRFQSLLSFFFPLVAADSCAMRTAWKIAFTWVHPRLGNTSVLPCLSSSPFGCAVCAIDVQPRLESHRHLPDRPSSGPKTRGVVECPKGPARGGSGRATSHEYGGKSTGFEWHQPSHVQGVSCGSTKSKK